MGLSIPIPSLTHGRLITSRKEGEEWPAICKEKKAKILLS
jgi:hypothetical protein